MKEVKTLINSDGHRIIQVVEGDQIVWGWNLTVEPDAFMHVSTEAVRALCQHTFTMESELSKQQRRAEQAHLEEAKVVTSFGKRLNELERQVTEVRALHHKNADGWCAACTQQPDGQWPCPTIRALASDPVEKPGPVKYA